MFPVAIIQKLFLFLSAGGFSFLVGLTALYLMQEVFAIPYLVAVPISALIAATVHHGASRQFVFESTKRALLQEYAIFMGVTFFVILLITIGVYIGVEFFSMNVYIARTLVAAFVAVLSFFVHKRFTFKNT